MPASIPTLAHYLRSVDYHTVLCGKMHFVGPDQVHGFDERIVTDIYPSNFAWTPDWIVGERYRPTGINMRAVVDSGICVRGLQIDYDDEVENSGVSLQADWDISDSVLLTSITAMRDQSRFDNVDVDFTSAALLQRNTGDTELETFTQELRLSGATESTDWMLGAFYFDQDVDTAICVLPDLRPGGLFVNGGVGRIFKLMGSPVFIGIGGDNALCFFNCGGNSFGAVSEDDFCSQ